MSKCQNVKKIRKESIIEKYEQGSGTPEKMCMGPRHSLEKNGILTLSSIFDTHRGAVHQAGPGPEPLSTIK